MNKRQRWLAGAAAQGGGRKMLKKAIAFILGLVLLARYQNYFLIMSAVCLVMEVIFSQSLKTF